jgi:hypothetical protein
MRVGAFPRFVENCTDRRWWHGEGGIKHGKFEGKIKVECRARGQIEIERERERRRLMGRGIIQRVHCKATSQQARSLCKEWRISL